MLSVPDEYSSQNNNILFRQNMLFLISTFCVLKIKLLITSAKLISGHTRHTGGPESRNKVLSLNEHPAMLVKLKNKIKELTIFYTD